MYKINLELIARLHNSIFTYREYIDSVCPEDGRTTDVAMKLSLWKNIRSCSEDILEKIQNDTNVSVSVTIQTMNFPPDKKNLVKVLIEHITEYLHNPEDNGYYKLLALQPLLTLTLIR